MVGLSDGERKFFDCFVLFVLFVSAVDREKKVVEGHSLRLHLREDRRIGGGSSHGAELCHGGVTRGVQKFASLGIVLKRVSNKFAEEWVLSLGVTRFSLQQAGHSMIPALHFLLPSASQYDNVESNSTTSLTHIIHTPF